MANTTIHVTTLTANAATANPTGTAIAAANTHVVTPTVPLRRVFLRFTNSFAGAKVFTILAGDNPPADAAGQGNLTKSLAQDEVWWVGPLTSARFLQNDGTVQITVEAATTGFIEAFQVPKGA